MIFQAKKRKMGLPEDDEKEVNIDERKGIDDTIGIVKARGKLILRWRLICSRWMVHIFWHVFLFADNSDRAFYKELFKVIEASDVILEVLDARDPLGTRCVDMEKMVMKSGPDKHLVLLLNKIGKFCISLAYILNIFPCTRNMSSLRNF